MFLNVHLFFTGCEKIQSRLNQITYKKMTGSDFASDGADTEPFFLPVADNCLLQPIQPLAAD